MERERKKGKETIVIRTKKNHETVVETVEGGTNRQDIPLG